MPFKKDYKTKYPGMKKNLGKPRKKKDPRNWDKWHKKEGHARVLTEKQRQYLYYIRSFQYKNRFSPTRLDLANFFGHSPENAARYVRCLIKYGYLEMSDTWPLQARRILFPRNFSFPNDPVQFPPEVFPPDIWLKLRSVRK